MVRTTIPRVIIVTFQTTTWFEFNQGLYSLFLTFFNSIQKKVVHIPSTCSGHATLLWYARHTIFSFIWLPMTVLSLQQRWCGIIFEKFEFNWYLLKLLKVVHRLVKCNFNCFPAFSHQWVTVRWLRYWPGTTIFLIILYKLWCDYSVAQNFGKHLQHQVPFLPNSWLSFLTGFGMASLSINQIRDT